jgi:hypothetical protein
MHYSNLHPNDMILRDHLAYDRTVLANERTLLAYIRTSIALFTMGAERANCSFPFNRSIDPPITTHYHLTNFLNSSNQFRRHRPILFHAGMVVACFIFPAGKRTIDKDEGVRKFSGDFR